MTFDERVQAIAKKGFTERQGRFLTTVMLHTGVCVPRQYARFCGIVTGKNIYSNVMGGQTKAVQLVGMFEHADNLNVAPVQ